MFEKAADIASMRPGTIAGCIGPEGSGKSSLETGICGVLYSHGWEIRTFPGYHFLNGGKVVSKELTPDEWVDLPVDLCNLVIVIPEADTHFDSLDSQFNIAKEMRNLAKQRRKRGLTILYDVQDWSWFNNRLRGLTHILFQCWDMYWTYRNNPDFHAERGKEILVTPIDCKGFYTGRPWTQGTPFKFDASKVWDNFDTTESTRREESASAYRVKQQKREILIDAAGKIVPQGNDLVPSISIKSMAKLVEQYKPMDNPLRPIVDTFIGKGVNRIPVSVIQQAFPTISHKVLGTFMNSLGFKYRNLPGGNNVYVPA